MGIVGGDWSRRILLPLIFLSFFAGKHAKPSDCRAMIADAFKSRTALEPLEIFLAHLQADPALSRGDLLLWIAKFDGSPLHSAVANIDPETSYNLLRRLEISLRKNISEDELSEKRALPRKFRSFTETVYDLKMHHFKRQLDEMKEAIEFHQHPISLFVALTDPDLSGLVAEILAEKASDKRIEGALSHLRSFLKDSKAKSHLRFSELEKLRKARKVLDNRFRYGLSARGTPQLVEDRPVSLYRLAFENPLKRVPPSKMLQAQKLQMWQIHENLMRLVFEGDYLEILPYLRSVFLDFGFAIKTSQLQDRQKVSFRKNAEFAGREWIADLIDYRFQDQKKLNIDVAPLEHLLNRLEGIRLDSKADDYSETVSTLVNTYDELIDSTVAPEIPALSQIWALSLYLRAWSYPVRSVQLKAIQGVRKLFDHWKFDKEIDYEWMYLNLADADKKLKPIMAEAIDFRMRK